MKNIKAFPFEIRPMSKDEGGGYLIRYTDFNECISDGDTIEEAISNGRMALKETILALKEANLPIPTPSVTPTASGKFVARVPKSVHANLASRAKLEGISLNTLVVSLLSEALALRGQRYA